MGGCAGGRPAGGGEGKHGDHREGDDDARGLDEGRQEKPRAEPAEAEAWAHLNVKKRAKAQWWVECEPGNLGGQVSMAQAVQHSGVLRACGAEALR